MKDADKMTYDDRIMLRDELYREFTKLGIIDKLNRLIKVNLRNASTQLNEKWTQYSKEFENFDTASYCLTHHDDFEDHKCPICNNICPFQTAKPKRFKRTCGDMKCVGAILHTEESREKAQQSIIKHYGVAHQMQSEEVKAKARQTNLKRYGTESPTQSDQVKEKIKQTNLQQFGVEWIMQSKEYLEKAQQTNLKRYGDTCSARNEQVKEKAKQTNLKRYGFICSSKNEQVKAKAVQTNLQRYGTENPMQSDKIKEKVRRSWQLHCGTIDPVLEKEVLELFNNQYELSDIYSRDDLFKQLIIRKYEEKGRYLRLKEIANIFDYNMPTIKNRAAKLDLMEYFYIRDSELELQFKQLLESTHLTEYNKDNQTGDFIRYERSVLFPTETSCRQELDFLLKDKKIAFEINDVDGHCCNRKDNLYHINKTLNCNNAGIRLIHIWEWEMTNEDLWERVSGWVVDLLDDSKNRIYTRKCEVGSVSLEEEKVFLNKYHLQGYRRSEICIGLYYNNKLVQLMSFCKPRYNKNYEWELLRLCTKCGNIIVGGSQRILENFVKHYGPKSIISYCNLDKFDGSVYESLGFNLLKRNAPSRVWYNPYTGKKFTHKSLMILGPDKLIKTDYGKGSSNVDIMRNSDYKSVYDCDQNVYVKLY